MLLKIVTFLLFVNTLTLLSNNVSDSIRNEISKLPDNSKKAGLYIDLVFSFRGSHIDSMGFYISKAEKILENNMDSLILARLYNAKGNMYRYYEKNDQSLKFYQKSLDINRKIANKKEQINNLGNIGQIYLLTKDYSSALQNAFEVLKLSKEINYPKGVMHAFKDVAYTYFNMDSLELSLENYNLSLKVANKIDDPMGASYSYLGMGEVFMKRANFLKAEENLLKAYNYYKSINAAYLIMVSAQKLGFVYNRTAKYSLAKEFLYESATIAKEIKMFGELKGAYEGLAESYENIGNLKLAFQYFKDADLIEDSLQVLEQTKILKELDNQYRERDLMKRNTELENNMSRSNYYQLTLIFIIVVILLIVIGLYLRFKEKNKINLKLEEQNNTIRTINEELEEANSTKDKFFSIIAHDLKGPLGSFNNLISFMVNSYDDFSDEERKEFLESINISSTNIYSLLENLLEWARSQRNMITFHPEPTNLYSLANLSINELTSLGLEKNINIKNNIPEDIIITLDPKLTQTVFRNLISNSIKFTPNNGSINLNIIEDNDKYTISIRDTGIGMEEEKISKLFKLDNSKTTYGTNQEKGTGLGLLICKDFVELHKGNIWAESELEVGTSFYFTIPKQILN